MQNDFAKFQKEVKTKEQSLDFDDGQDTQTEITLEVSKIEGALKN